MYQSGPPIKEKQMTYEVVVRYNNGSLRGELEVVSEGTLEDVKAELYDWRLVYKGIGRVYYRKVRPCASLPQM